MERSRAGTQALKVHQYDLHRPLTLGPQLCLDGSNCDSLQIVVFCNTVLIADKSQECQTAFTERFNRNSNRGYQRDRL